MEEAAWWHERSDGIGVSQAQDFELLHREQSPYQLIEIFEHRVFGRFLVLDGYVQASQADEFIYHEMAVHVPLLGRARKDASVLIVGGGDGGILREVLKHDFVTEVTMVEIDRRVIELSNQYLAIEGNYDDRRVSLIVGDAGDFVRQSQAAGRRFDLIILDLTEPVGPSAAIFTREFCQILAETVRDDGVIIDSDSLFLTLAGGKFLQEVSGGGDNLVTAMARDKFLPHMEVYRANIPFYPGGDFGFFAYSRHGESLRQPVREFTARHYCPEVHHAAFALAPWQREWIAGLGSRDQLGTE